VVHAPRKYQAAAGGNGDEDRREEVVAALNTSESSAKTSRHGGTSHKTSRQRLHPCFICEAQARLAKGVGHAWNAERPDLFTATVKAWCAQGELPDELINLSIQ
jgi:hypothetical protein